VSSCAAAYAFWHCGVRCQARAATYGLKLACECSPTVVMGVSGSVGCVVAYGRCAHDFHRLPLPPSTDLKVIIARSRAKRQAARWPRGIALTPKSCALALMSLSYAAFIFIINLLLGWKHHQVLEARRMYSNLTFHATARKSPPAHPHHQY